MREGNNGELDRVPRIGAVKKRTRRRFLIALGWGFAAWVGIVVCGALWAGSVLCDPAHSTIGEPPPGFDARSVTFPSGSGTTLHGWFLHGEAGRGAVILMHELRGNRRSMVRRARFLSDSGYSVLLFDFQAHGMSHGKHITFGHLESHDAVAAVRFIRSSLPGERIAVIGWSLGGAACLLADEPLELDALILEAVYPDIDSAVANRLRLHLGWPGSLLAPFLTWQIRPRLGVDKDRLRPIDHISGIACPLLLIAGTEDTRTTIQESRALFEAAKDPKDMWEVDGADHVDLMRYAGEEYEKRIGLFLARRLRGED